MKNKWFEQAGDSTSVIKWLWKVSGKRKLQILALLTLQSLLGIVAVSYAMVLRGMIDAAVDGEGSLFKINACLLVGLIIVQIGCQACYRFLEENARATLENRFKSKLFSVLLKKDYEAVTSVHSGEWMNRLTSDSVVVADGLVQIVPNAVGMLVKMCGALLMILFLEPRFGFVLIPGGILLVIVSTVFRKRMKSMHKKIQEKDGKLRMFLQEHMGSLMITRAFAMEEQVVKEANAKMADHKKARMERNHFSNFSRIGFSVVMQGVTIFSAIYCAFGIMKGTVTYGTLTAILQLISQVQNPMANITGYIPKYYAMLASAERLMEIEKLNDDLNGKAHDIRKIHSYYEQTFSGMGLKDASFTYLPPTGDLKAELSKEDQPIVLRHVNLEVKKGDYIAFTGQSGCGKSTILKLFMCLYRLDAGERYLLNKDGSYQELNSSWHKLFAYVPQGNQLFSGTIREVIAFSDKERMQEEEQMRKAIQIACADEFIDEMEQGLDTLLGERGQGLSEGQMQRIAIARAVFSDNPILILDEATSALDEVTEEKVLENLKTMTDKTILIVTHRPAALNICNRKVTMTEDGMHIENMER